MTSFESNNRISSVRVDENRRKFNSTLEKDSNSKARRVSFWIDQDPKWKKLVDDHNSKFKEFEPVVYDPIRDGTAKNLPNQDYDNYREVLENFLHRVVPRGVIGHNWRGKYFYQFGKKKSSHNKKNGFHLCSLIFQ